MKIILVRHGETLGNLEKKYIGKTDETLCDAGIKKILDFVSKKKYPDADVVFSSPMKRCLETAALIFPEKKIFVLKKFTEIDFGSFEGKNFCELEKNPDYKRWISSGGKTDFPNGEKKSHFIKRSIGSFFTMVKKAQKLDAKKICAVIHGGNIMAVLSSLTGKNYFDFQIANGEFYSFDLLCDKNKNFFVNNLTCSKKIGADIDFK